MNRRGFFARLIDGIAALASGITLAQSSDGVALTSMAHPNWPATPEEMFGEGNFYYDERAFYATSGEQVTCENGHVMCEFSRDIPKWKMFEKGDQVAWRQPEPEVGAPNPTCKTCGARAIVWPYFHFVDGWRIAS